MNHDQIQARNAKELIAIQKKIASAVKKTGCNTGDIRWYDDETGLHCVEIDNDGKLGGDLSDIIKKAPTARLQAVKEYIGDYDWKADVYIRPVSLISFKF